VVQNILRWAKNVHDEERSGRPAICSDDSDHSAAQKMCERRHFIISELSSEFSQISHTLFYEIITNYEYVKLSQVLRKMGSENAHGCAQNADNGFGCDIFRAIPERWR
jgi:hypothetical protein